MSPSEPPSDETPELLEVADALYALPLERFTPERDARVKELRREHPDLAVAVKALRRPTLAAWVVNLLVRRDAAQTAQLMTLGQSLREAAAALSGDDLRALTRQRRQLTAAVITGARRLAGEEGVRVTQAVADQVEATLTAALLHAEAADAVRSGLLVAPLTPAGVAAGEVAAALAAPEALGFAAAPRAAEPPPRPELHVVPDPDAAAKALAAAREALAEAQEEVDRVRAEVDDVTADVERLEARGLQVQAEIEEVRRRLAELEQESEEVDEELAEAEDARTEATSALASAVADRDAAARTVTSLGG